MFQEDDLEYRPRIRISEPDDSIQLQQLGIGDAQALFDTVSYDRNHLLTFAPSLVSDITSVQSAVTKLANFDAAKIKFGIWDEDSLRGGIDLMPRPSRQAEVGYWVGSEHIGNSYASRATKLLARWTFRMTSFDNIYAKIRIDNLPSQKSITKAGFQFESEHEGWLRFVLSRDEINLS